ncbi:MAG: hypothetical protein JO303_06135 [Caulobacteraceae bacterium]|nr:hypothetical protein [Caulobacteraceae bacterium]
MPKMVFLVFTNAVEGEDDAFNEWYEHQHLPDLLKVEGVSAAQRFAMKPAPEDAAQFPWKYLAIYEIDHTDIPAFQAALGKIAGTSAMPLSPALDGASVKTVFAAAIGERQTA